MQMLRGVVPIQVDSGSKEKSCSGCLLSPAERSAVRSARISCPSVLLAPTVAERRFPADKDMLPQNKVCHLFPCPEIDILARLDLLESLSGSFESAWIIYTASKRNVIESPLQKPATNYHAFHDRTKSEANSEIPAIDLYPLSLSPLS